MPERTTLILKSLNFLSAFNFFGNKPAVQPQAIEHAFGKGDMRLDQFGLLA